MNRRSVARHIIKARFKSKQTAVLSNSIRIEFVHNSSRAQGSSGCVVVFVVRVIVQVKNATVTIDFCAYLQYFRLQISRQILTFHGLVVERTAILSQRIHAVCIALIPC